MARYVAAMKPLLETVWSTGEDFGVRQDMLDEVAAEAGLRSTIEAALRLLPDPDGVAGPGPGRLRGRGRRGRPGRPGRRIRGGGCGRDGGLDVGLRGPGGGLIGRARRAAGDGAGLRLHGRGDGAIPGRGRGARSRYLRRPWPRGKPFLLSEQE